MDLTSYPSNSSFSGDNPGMVSCEILNTSATPTPLYEDGITWTELKATNSPSCSVDGQVFTYDPASGGTVNAIVVMRGGMMKVGYPCLNSGACSAGTLEYVEYGLMSSSNSGDNCNTLGANIDPHSIDGVEISGVGFHTADYRSLDYNIR